MFIYLSKKIKIAIPNPIPLNAISWNREQKWIACGGQEGLLKVIALDSDDKGKSGTNLSMNQTLDGHNGAVRVITWNEHHRKLTTSDQYGLIIVWMLYKGQWYEEMINNRNKSVVADMKWNSDGQKICIVYEDGEVIVGSVDGNRMWSKPLRLPLQQVEWSPNGKVLLFGTSNGEVHLFDHKGNFISKMELTCLEGTTGEVKLVTMEWYSGNFGYIDHSCPVLAVCYESGRMQLMRSESDTNPVLIDCVMKIASARWNYNGTVLAVAGKQAVEGSKREQNCVQFYTPFGDHLRTLMVPGENLTGISWEKGGLRLALTVDHYIYFANVRPDYRWGYFAGTVVYAFNKPERDEHCVVFWNSQTGQRTTKYIKNLIGIAAAGNHCVVTTKTDDTGAGQYSLILLNAIGTAIDSRESPVEPVYLTMTSTHIVAASNSNVYLWHYAHKGSDTRSRKRDEKIFHIDDSPTGGKDTDPTKFRRARPEARDEICAMCASDTMLMVARESGLLQQYSLPKAAMDMKHTLGCRPARISLNSNSSRLAVLDIDGILTFFDHTAKVINPETGAVQYGERIPGFERKDVWDLCWADDNPELFAMMERNYMYIFRDLDPEEPIASTSYICNFSSLQVESVNLDTIMKDPDHPTRECYAAREIKSLRDTRTLLDTVTIEDAYSYIEQNPHIRLWRLLAEAALDKLDLEIADKAFVRCKDLQGIEFVKRLIQLEDLKKQQAEVAVYFQRFDEAQQLYLDMDRGDLAIAMRAKLGDWFRVVKLIRSGVRGQDMLLERAWNEIGNYYFDRQRFDEARNYYRQASNNRRLAECCYKLEDWHGLQEMIYLLPEGDELLRDLGSMFTTVGLCDAAVSAYKKVPDIQECINVCVQLNQWDLAVKVANEHNVKEIDVLLAKYASHLLSKDKKVEAIELYRQANHYIEAAKLLFALAEDMASDGNPLKCKQLYVLGALQIEEYKEMKKSQAHDPTQSTLDGLLDEDHLDEGSSRLLDTAWRGAEAYHFLILAQKQLYSGHATEALRSAVRLAEYDDIVDPLQVYSILALAAVATESFGLCSKAFIKMEALGGDQGPKYKAQIEALARDIFSQHPPKDQTVGVIQCVKCYADNPDWSAVCVACDFAFLPSIGSGRPMVDLEYWICSACKHRASEAEISRHQCCPLCHTPM
eukprot:m.27924 g.27924  ORF g.27924 m.27924 type:complete len:1165 (+) comp8999_c0_seq1:165-3659(+)